MYASHPALPLVPRMLVEDKIGVGRSSPGVVASDVVRLSRDVCVFAAPRLPRVLLPRHASEAIDCVLSGHVHRGVSACIVALLYLSAPPEPGGHGFVPFSRVD